MDKQEFEIATQVCAAERHPMDEIPFSLAKIFLFTDESTLK